MAAGRTFWDFSLELYGRPGVAEACLALQDSRGLDVNLLLLCCWTGDRGQALSWEDMIRLIAAARPWQDEVVRPLRAVRRWLKTQDRAPAEAAQALRQAVKGQELEAERLEQAILAAEIAALGPRGDVDPLALAGANLRIYVTRLGLALAPEDLRHLAVLLKAARPGTSMDQARAAIKATASEIGLGTGAL